MSGHSKWSTIKRQKEATDKKRGQAYSKLGKVITIAARNGADPETNFKLRLAIEKGRQMNMPKENIKRAIEKGSGGKGGEQLAEIIYEGYGPFGMALIIETVTDNRNRTSAEIKNILERIGGGLASPGAVTFQFKKTGLITVQKGSDVDSQMLSLIDLGAEDVEEAKDVIEVYSKPKQLDQIKEKILQAGLEVLSAELIMEPISQVKIENSAKAQKIIKLMETLENHDDIQKVYANFDITSEVLEKRRA